MRLREEDLFRVAQRFRAAIIDADFSAKVVGEETHDLMDLFPNGTCSYVCTLLGIYLKSEYRVDPLINCHARIEEGNSWFGTHEWLEHDGNYYRHHGRPV